MRCKKTIKNIIFLLLFLIILFVNHNFGIVKINGNSMEPSLMDGSKKIFYKKYSNLDIGKSIIFKNSGTVYVKRIVAMPGSHIEEREEGLYINDIKYGDYKSSLPYSDYTLGNDNFYVLGDNVTDSIDSRDYGPISKEDFIGILIK